MSKTIPPIPFSQGHYTSFHEDEHEWALKGCRTCIVKLLQSRESHEDWKDCCPDCMEKLGLITIGEENV